MAFWISAAKGGHKIFLQTISILLLNLYNYTPISQRALLIGDGNPIAKDPGYLNMGSKEQLSSVAQKGGNVNKADLPKLYDKISFCFRRT